MLSDWELWACANQVLKTHGENAPLHVAEQIGVCRPTLYNWKNQLLGQETAASMNPQNQPSSSAETEELERQLEVLRRDIHRLQLEHDLLKKANELLKKTRASTCRP